jgi:hypothetical protein
MYNSGECSDLALCYNGKDLAWGKMLLRGLGIFSTPGTPKSEKYHLWFAIDVEFSLSGSS